MRHQFKGKPTVAWTAKELIWLHAMLSLPAFDMLCAMDDIASMSGRTIGAIAARAKALRREAQPTPKRTPSILITAPVTVLEPLRQPSLAQLMSGKAR